METLVVAHAPEKVHEGPVALPFNPDEDDSSTLNPTPPPQRASAESRQPAKDAGPVLRIQPDITPKALHILGTVDTGSSAIALLDDEDLFLFQIVEKADVV